MPPRPDPAHPRPITLLTDYGIGGEHVGALHLVLAAACPAADRIDIAHDIPPGDVRWGALTLERHAPLLGGAVHLAVVDPGVGGPRRALALELDDGSFAVGPDNGLLSLLGRRRGMSRAVDLGDPPADAAATFHGRDLFAPAAAHLASGAPLSDLGNRVSLTTVCILDLPAPRQAPGVLIAEVAGRDRFGNVSLLAARADLAHLGDGGEIVVELGHERHPAHIARHFEDVPTGGLIVYVDSNGAISIARRGGDAWTDLGCRAGDTARISTT